VIVCIGDSITTGQCLEPDESPWPSLLNGHEVFVSASPGDTTRIALERFPEVQALGPDAVIIQFGHNDCNRWRSDRGLQRVSERAFEANLAEMIARARAFRIVPFLCSLTRSYKDQRHAADTGRYDRIIRDLASLKDVALIDVRAVIEREHIMDDGIHLTAAGHALFAETVLDTIGLALVEVSA
jgi:lysophospholipase L1-like esterase